jgi:Ca2+-binding EF-hand superfamily protein
MQMDTDKDGKLSTEEAKVSSVVSSGFAKADADGDGSISRDEFMSTFTTRTPTAPPPAVPTPPSE